MVAQWEWKGNSTHLDIQIPQIKELKTRDHLFLMDTKPTFTKQLSSDLKQKLQAASFNIKM